MTNEGETQYHVIPLKGEPVVTGTKQVLKLGAIKSATTNIPALVAPVEMKETVRKMMFGVVKLAGTAPSIVVLKEMIEKEQLTEV